VGCKKDLSRGGQRMGVQGSIMAEGKGKPDMGDVFFA